MADFLTEIPQHIEDRLGDPFAALTRRAGEEKQKIDVRSRRKSRPAVAPNRGDHELLALRTGRGRMNITGYIIENLADQIVFDMRETAGAGKAAAVRQECIADETTGVVQGIAQQRDRLLAR